MAGPKPLLSEFGIQHRMQSCAPGPSKNEDTEISFFGFILMHFLFPLVSSSPVSRRSYSLPGINREDTFLNVLLPKIEDKVWAMGIL